MAEPEPVSKLKSSQIPAMSVYLMVRRHKTTVFLQAQESSTVLELKQMVQGILQHPPEQQRLYKDDQVLEDTKTLHECGFNVQTAPAQAPATVGLAFGTDVAFEALCIEPYSCPGDESSE